MPVILQKTHTLVTSEKAGIARSPNLVLSYQCCRVNDLKMPKHLLEETQMCKLVTSQRLYNQQVENQKSSTQDQPRKAKALSFLALNSHKDNLGLKSSLGLVVCYLSAAAVEPSAFKKFPVIPAVYRCGPFDLIETCVYLSANQEQVLSQEFNAVLCCHLNPVCREPELGTSQIPSP